MNSSTQTFSPEQILLVKQLLSLSQPQDSTNGDTTDETDSEVSGDENSSDSGGDEPSQPKRGRGRPKKILTEEQVAARAASKARGRGRPRNPPPTEEEVAARAESKARGRGRPKNPPPTEEEVAARESKALAMKQKRTEIYQRMLAEAEEYRLKWELSSF
jgi:hypothetical protein